MIFATDLKQIKEHIALSKCEEVADIMLPLLNKHGITVFNYYRMFFDGTVIRLSSDRSWTEHYFKKGYINQLTVPESYLQKPLNYFIWQNDDCPEMLLDAAINFDTSNGISIALKQPDSIEYYCFATTRSNTTIVNNFYINNLDLLLQYGAFFKERADSLIKMGEKNKIITTKSINLSEENNSINSLQRKHSSALSNRQFHCATFLLKGLSQKEIALQLNISPRTVETHLNNLKIKLACRNKSELITKLSTLAQISLVDNDTYLELT